MTFHRGSLRPQCSDSSRGKHRKVRRPMIANVVIADSSKPSQIAIVKPGEKRKKAKQQNSSSGPGLASVQPKPSILLPSPSPPAEQMLSGWEYPRSSVHSQELPTLRRKPSAMEMSKTQLPSRPDVLRATRSTPRLHAKLPEQLQTMPPMSSETSAPHPNTRSRKPTPTYYSIASNSTKLGEIPLHKWTEPHDFDAMSRMNKEALQNGWPVSDDQIEQEKRKTGMGFFRFFRRKNRA
jgi:hypothetical protein